MRKRKIDHTRCYDCSLDTTSTRVRRSALTNLCSRHQRGTIDPWPASIEIVARDDGAGIFGITERTYALGGRASETARYDIVRADDGAFALRCTLETRVWYNGPADLFPATPTSSPNAVDVFHANTRALMALL